MKKFFQGIGKIIVGALGWLVGAGIVLSLLALLVSFGTIVLGAIAVIVVIALIAGAVSKVFGLGKKKNKIIEVSFNEDGRS